MTITGDIATRRLNVLAAVRAVPCGFVTTYDAIAAAQDLMPRHVRHILADIGGSELADVPWHRVVAIDGRLDASDAERFKQQKHALLLEGVAVDEEGQIPDFLSRLTQILAITRIETPPERRKH